MVLCRRMLSVLQKVQSRYRWDQDGWTNYKANILRKCLQGKKLLGGSREIERKAANLYHTHIHWTQKTFGSDVLFVLCVYKIEIIMKLCKIILSLFEYIVHLVVRIIFSLCCASNILENIKHDDKQSLESREHHTHYGLYWLNKVSLVHHAWPV